MGVTVLTVVPAGRLNPLPPSSPSPFLPTVVRAEVKWGMPREANDVIRSDSVTTACVKGIDERSENDGSRSDPITWAKEKVLGIKESSNILQQSGLATILPT